MAAYCMVVLSRKPWPRASAEGVGKDPEVHAIFGEAINVLAEIADRPQHPAAMAERDAEILQILVRQLA